MTRGSLGRHVRLVVCASGVALALATVAERSGAAQQPARPAAPAGAVLLNARTIQPLDLTGYWVSVVTEDWRWRMITGPKGDYRGVPFNAEGRRVAEAWDLAKDNASGNQCKAYGAAGLMRLPTRVHFTWENDQTLRLDTDAGKQTRLFHMVKGSSVGGGLVAEALQDKPAMPTIQGYSIGVWELRDDGAPRGGIAIMGGKYVEPPQRMGKGSLKAVTVGMRAGYLRKNGLPYSEKAVLTEYYDRHEDFGTQWFTVTTVVDDPTYLATPFITTTSFKKEADASKWSPSACETMPPTAEREEFFFQR